jgi:pimeloyl-ACP methyl ester carboxylesterase
VLAWRSEGPDDGSPVVLLHGLGETMRCWDRVVPLLRDAGARVVLVDLPGFGESPGGGRGATIGEFAHEVASVLREVDAREATVAGHSLGGAVAVALAEQAPDLVARLVLANAPPSYEARLTARSGTEGLMRKAVIGPLMWRMVNEDRAREGLRTAFAPGNDVPDEFIADLCATSWGSFAGGTRALDDYLAERNLGERVAALGIPVTVVFGEQDKRIDASSLAVFDDARDATVVRVPDAGHTPIWETPDQVVAALTEVARS